MLVNTNVYGLPLPFDILLNLASSLEAFETYVRLEGEAAAALGISYLPETHAILCTLPEQTVPDHGVWPQQKEQRSARRIANMSKRFKLRPRTATADGVEHCYTKRARRVAWTETRYKKPRHKMSEALAD